MNRRWRAWLGPIAGALILLGGCANHATQPGDDGLPPPPAPAPGITELEFYSAPTMALVQGAEVRASGFAWRDFMPSVGGSDQRLRVVIRLAGDSTPFVPIGVQPEYVWVRHGADDWSAELGVPRRDWDGSASAGTYGGPEWAVSDTVQAVAGIRDSSGTLNLIRCPDGVIAGTS